MGAFDGERTLRWLKPHKWTATLQRRPDAALSFAEDAPPTGEALLLDTCVYADILQNTAPPSLDRHLGGRQIQHSTVTLAELTHLLGRLQPDHPSTPETRRRLLMQIEHIPARRLHAPDAAVMGAAGVLAGMLFRTQGYAKGQEYRVLHDAVLFLQARQQGWTVLTRNVGDFDLLQQMVPDGRVLFYRPTAAA